MAKKAKGRSKAKPAAAKPALPGPEPSLLKKRWEPPPGGFDVWRKAFRTTPEQAAADAEKHAAAERERAAIDRVLRPQPVVITVPAKDAQESAAELPTPLEPKAWYTDYFKEHPKPRKMRVAAYAREMWERMNVDYANGNVSAVLKNSKVLANRYYGWLKDKKIERKTKRNNKLK